MQQKKCVKGGDLMRYNYPTEKGIKFAINEGWSEEQAKRGFDIFDYDCTGLLGIEAICDCYPDDDYDDESAAREAERIGFCKIIPVDELPDFYNINGDNMKWFGWIDTRENRELIKKWSGV